MRNWKLALAAAVLVAPLGSLNAGAANTSVASTAATAPKPVTAVEDGAQGWGCCWVFFMGRWRCLPC